MFDVFAYTDYRLVLRHYYQDKKRASPGFSYQTFSRKAGLASKSFLYNVIQGRKNLSRTTAAQLCQAMRLSRAESEYFENLVSFNHARTLEQREYFLKRMNAIRAPGPDASKAKRLRKDQLDFFSEWHHVAIWSLLEMKPFDGDTRALAKMLRPEATVPQVRNSLALLQRLGLVRRLRNGTYKVADKVVSTGPEVKSHAVQRFHQQTIRLAERALSQLPRSERSISGLTLGISRKTYEQICLLLQQTQQRLLQMAREDAEADGVYQLDFSFFPIASLNHKGGGR